MRAVVLGLAVAAAGTLPWAALATLNLEYMSALPWAVPVMAVYLWLFWKYVRGAGWPRTTAVSRRVHARANPVSEQLWGPALLAGMIGLVTVLLLQGVLARLVVLPQQQDLDIDRYPALTVLCWVLMASVVAGIVEETAFRGYMQRPIERRHGPVVAILVTGLVFGALHFTHAEVTLALIPFYLAAAAVYGALAYFTDSTWPSIWLHAGGNAFSAFTLFTQGRSEWSLTATQPPLVWDTGVDGAFFAALAAFLVAAALTVLAYVGLARSRGGSRAGVQADR